MYMYMPWMSITWIVFVTIPIIRHNSRPIVTSSSCRPATIISGIVQHSTSSSYDLVWVCNMCIVTLALLLQPHTHTPHTFKQFHYIRSPSHLSLYHIHQFKNGIFSFNRWLQFFPFILWIRNWANRHVLCMETRITKMPFINGEIHMATEVHSAQGWNLAGKSDFDDDECNNKSK